MKNLKRLGHNKKLSPLDYLDVGKAIFNPDLPKLKYSNKNTSKRILSEKVK